MSDRFDQQTRLRELVHTCTTEEPWNRNISRKAEHPDAAYVRDRDYGDGEVTAVYRCPHCDLQFEVELPQ